MARPVVLALVPLLCFGGALAQIVPASQPYAGLQARAVKTLSEQQIADLRAGRGMGLALPAELNGYPGPLHTLENAEALALTPDQQARTEALLEAMRAETVPIGERLIQQEADLDSLFASQTVHPANLGAATAAIGATQGQLRAAHLRYHLAMMDVLTPEQVRRYGEVRGYGGAKAGPTGAHQGHGQHGQGAHRP
jgi:Spy/CpxP family protein refolding chaperone